LRRIQKAGASTIKYYYDDLNCVAEYDGSDTFLRSYVTPGLDDNLTIYTSSTLYYYVQDGLGSIRNIVDGNETAQNSYDYFAFGKDYGTPTQNVTNTFKFTARRWDSESSLYYFRARYYDQAAGRFTQKDTALFAEGTNNWIYTRNNPRRDPTGKKTGDKLACTPTGLTVPSNPAALPIRFLGAMPGAWHGSSPYGFIKEYYPICVWGRRYQRQFKCPCACIIKGKKTGFFYPLRPASDLGSRMQSGPYFEETTYAMPIKSFVGVSLWDLPLASWRIWWHSPSSVRSTCFKPVGSAAPVVTVDTRGYSCKEL